MLEIHDAQVEIGLEVFWINFDGARIQPKHFIDHRWVATRCGFKALGLAINSVDIVTVKTQNLRIDVHLSNHINKVRQALHGQEGKKVVDLPQTGSSSS